MFLKTLTLKGFKSFADATVLEMEPGVTVVVGPNGSGKSNVVDAIGWVLGAQAPSAVRSQKMDDVIFAGTTNRPALGRAEVSLCIDNTSGLLAIEFSEVTITRILFRNGDSEYALNGVPCRLLDIQELLSDSGVGRQQHVIISQGQIDAVLNARPEERRLIIEEAAGVLKYRRRKERSERRLASTEANFTRLQDVLREVRRGLRPLQRQADAARRHGAVVAELHALRVYVAGRELHRLRSRLSQGTATRQELARNEKDLIERLATVDATVLDAEARLSAMGADDLGDSLARFESLREKVHGLASLLGERRRSIERERASSVDQAVVATLEAEAARLADELHQVADELEQVRPELERLEVSEAALGEARTAFASRWRDGVPGTDGRAAEVRGELAARRAGVERTTAELERVESRLRELTEREQRRTAEAVALREKAADTERRLAELQRRAETAAPALTSAEDRQRRALEERRTAEADHHGWVARADALGQALDRARARAGQARLAEVGGVIGTLLDVVEIDDGWEVAFEAAAGEAVAAVVLEGTDAARRALSVLHDGDLAGSVLALGAPVSDPPGAAGESLRRHVRPAPRVADKAAVASLLDSLVGTVAVVDDWHAAVDLVVDRPGVVVVTRDGGRFGATGWRVGAKGAGATGAALDEAQRRAGESAEVAAAARAEAEAADSAVGAAREELGEATRARDRCSAELAAAHEAIERLDVARQDSAAEAASLRAQIAELGDQGDRDADELGRLESLLPALEQEEQAAAEAAETMAAEREALEDRTSALGVLRRDLEVRVAGLAERRQFLVSRRSEIEGRLARSRDERSRAEAHRVQLDLRQVATERLAAYVERRGEVIDAELGRLRERRRQQSEAARQVAVGLEAARRDRGALTTELEGLRERVRRAELDETETRLRVEQATAALRHDLEVEPDVAMAAAPPELPEGSSAAARVRELERDLRLMGPINPLALEEYEALQERHAFIEGQLDDIKTSRRELKKVLRAVDAEIMSVFSTAFADVEANFRQLFETLFPGGRGRLRLTDPDDLLSTGIEVEARPSGKNVRKLSLLSGGERSLTALAFLFAVFRARPSPFYVMDEVEAALDDVNLHRFLDLVEEFRAEAQLIVVSHQKRTMEAADCLYGVTMKPGGSSRVVSEKVVSRA